MKFSRRLSIAVFSILFVVACVDGEGIVPENDSSIDEERAVRTAVNWMELQYPSRDAFQVKNVDIVTQDGQVSSYNIEFEDGGFAIVSASYSTKPIMAFSDTSSLGGKDLQADLFIEGFSKHIARLDSISKTEKFNRLFWDNLVEPNADTRLVLRAGTSVTPFIKTKWGQSGGYEPNYTYNAATPYVTDEQAPTKKTRAPVGCAAVAFGQVLKHYNYPKTGQLYNAYCMDGSSAYNCPKIEVDFNTAYNWSDMPNSLGYSSSKEAIDAVSTLLYHVGASINVVYGYHGSGAKIANDSVFKGFRKHFRLGDIQKIRKIDYQFDEDGWYKLITDEIKAGRPVILSGTQENVGGHAYILDGLQENTGYVHVNWGWSGAANGYFDLNSLVIDGKYSFTEDLIAFINLTPNVVAKGGACNGKGGLRCGDGLVCALNNDINQPVDEFSSDAEGKCLALTPSTDDTDEDTDETADETTDETADETPDETADETADDTTMEPVFESGTIAKGSWAYYGPFTSETGIRVEMKGAGANDPGDADLYVRRDRQPTQYSYHCRPGEWGTDETCELNVAGTYYVAVYGYSEISEYNLAITAIAE